MELLIAAAVGGTIAVIGQQTVNAALAQWKKNAKARTLRGMVHDADKLKGLMAGDGKTDAARRAEQVVDAQRAAAEKVLLEQLQDAVADLRQP